VTGITTAGRPALNACAWLKWDAIRGNGVLLYPEGLLVLNDTAVAVLRLCDGRRSIAQIAWVLATQFDLPAEAIEPDVLLVLDRLMGKRLIEVMYDACG
jgi:pyrroloquinoline quinone biosynthesis protein D